MNQAHPVNGCWGAIMRAGCMKPHPITRHRVLWCAIVCCGVAASPVIAADRIRLVGPSEGDRAAKELMQSLADTCNNGDFPGFMSHFTTSRAAAIRKQMRDVFSRHDIEMDIQEVAVLSESDTRVVFRVKYSWNQRAAPKRVIDSKVVAAKTKAGWKLNSEQVQHASVQNHPGQEFDLGGGGHVALNPNDIEYWLPRDIGRIPGGCVGGQCGVRKSN